MLRKLFVPFIVICFFIGFVVVLSGGAGAIEYLVDIPSLLVAFIAPLVITVVTFGPSAFARSFSAPFEADTGLEELIAARAFFSCFLRYVIAFTLFAVVTGTIMLLGYLAVDNPEMIGRSLAVALLGLFYGSVGSLLFILPFLSEIDRRLTK